MTDYTKNASFTAKTGTTIQGAAFDSEFDEIATAIASKENSANKGAANGYAGLDASGLVDPTDLPAATATAQGAVELATTAEAVTGTDTTRAVTAAGVTAVLQQNGGLVWDLIGFSDPNADVILFWDDSAGQVNYLYPSTGLAISGANLIFDGNASNLTSGTIPDARVQASGVTQHQTSLTIAESQITDGAVLARVGGNETITGSWSFSAVPIYTGQGAFPHYGSSTHSSGIISVSTSAASGTPGAGDLWIQYTA